MSMAIQNFEEAVKKDNAPCELRTIEGETVEGFFANVRVAKESLPEGWYCYDIRHDDEGAPCEIKNGYIFVNHYGTFCTQTKLSLEQDNSWNVRCNDEADFELSFC